MSVSEHRCHSACTCNQNGRRLNSRSMLAVTEVYEEDYVLRDRNQKDVRTVTDNNCVRVILDPVESTFYSEFRVHCVGFANS